MSGTAVSQTILESAGELSAADDTLSTGEFYRQHPIQVPVDGALLLTLESSAFDPYLIARSDKGAKTYNDDFLGSRTESKVLLQVEAGDEWTLTATTYSPGEKGAYRVYARYVQGRELKEASVILFYEGTLGQDSDTLSTGEFVYAARLPTVAATPVQVELRSDELDTYLIARSSERWQLDNDDADGSQGFSRLTVLPTGKDTWDVLATTFAPGAAGAFTLKARPLLPDEIDLLPSPLSASDRLEAADDTLKTGEYVDSYQIPAGVSGPLMVRLRSSAFDTYLLARSSDGHQVDNDDHEGSRGESRLVLLPSDEESWTVMVTSYSRGETGEYQLDVRSTADSSTSLTIRPPVIEPPSVTAVRDTSDLFVISVGVDTYADPNLQLRFSASDASLIAETFLADQPDGAEPGDRTHTWLFTEEQATLEALEGAFQEVWQEADENDRFIFYYSGIGSALGDNGEFHFLLTGADRRIPETMPEHALSARQLRVWASRVRARNRLFLLDTPDTGPSLFDLANRLGAGEGDSSALLDYAGAVMGPAGMAYELSELRHGLFTFAALTGLEGAADYNRDGDVTVTELGLFLQSRANLEQALENDLPSVTEPGTAAHTALVEMRVVSVPLGDDFVLSSPGVRDDAASAAFLSVAQPLLETEGDSLTLSGNVVRDFASGQPPESVEEYRVLINGRPVLTDVSGSFRYQLAVGEEPSDVVIEVISPTGVVSAQKLRARKRPVASLRGIAVPATKDAAASQTLEGASYALIFATQEYEDDQWTDLVNPIFDAEALAATLTDDYGFKVELVRDATREQVLLKLVEYRQRSYSENDQLLVFFAGHGFYDESVGEGHLVMADSDFGDATGDEYILYPYLHRRLDAIPVKHLLLVLDVCFGGTFGETTRGGPDDDYGKLSRDEFITRKMSYVGRQFLTAGGKEYVSDGIPNQHSPFMYHFLGSLRTLGGRDGLLTLEEVFSDIEHAEPGPRQGRFGKDEPGSTFLFVAE
jgi:uncharacterized caspase-like protein